MRWAEGHTYNVKKYFWQILRSPNLTWQEKLEFVYYAPYYLQSVLFSFATLAWIIGVLILGQKLPMWGEVFGWSLVVSNALALPLMNLTGVLLEGSLQRDALGVRGRKRDRSRCACTGGNCRAPRDPRARLAPAAPAHHRDRLGVHARPRDERGVPRPRRSRRRSDGQHERVHVQEHFELWHPRHGAELHARGRYPCDLSNELEQQRGLRLHLGHLHNGPDDERGHGAGGSVSREPARTDRLPCLGDNRLRQRGVDEPHGERARSRPERRLHVRDDLFA